MQTLSPFSPSLKAINLKILPDGTIYSTSYPRKWIQIQIWTYGPQFNLHFKSLASPLCCRPSFWRFPEHRITLRVGMCPSCSTSHWKHWNNQKITRTSFFEAAGAPKMTSAKIRPIINFFGADVQTLSAFSVALKPINLKILPDGTIYSTSSPRKWIQIQIWTDGPQFNLQFKSLASSLCCRPSFWRFPEHRITLRVGMCPSCSTSHWKHWND